MTIERKIVVGLNDIQSLTFECTKCKSRLTVSPDKGNIPKQCPNCGKLWTPSDPRDYAQSTTTFTNFIESLRTIRTLLRNVDAGFKILLEFDEDEEERQEEKS